MGVQKGIPNIKPGDWTSVRQVIARLASRIGPVSRPTFAGLTITDLTASRLVVTDVNKQLVPGDLADWIAGTANQVIVTDDGDGTITLSTPQDIAASSSPTFAGLTSTGIIDASAGEILTEDNDTSEPDDRDDGYMGVAIIGGQPRIYFAVGDKMYYVDGSAAAAPETGNPIGLLLCLTYT